MGSKKIGRNKDKCKRYKDNNTREKNKLAKTLKLKKKLDKRRLARGEEIIENPRPIDGRSRSGK